DRRLAFPVERRCKSDNPRRLFWQKKIAQGSYRADCVREMRSRICQHIREEAVQRYQFGIRQLAPEPRAQGQRSPVRFSNPFERAETVRLQAFRNVLGRPERPIRQLRPSHNRKTDAKSAEYSNRQHESRIRLALERWRQSWTDDLTLGELERLLLTGFSVALDKAVVEPSVRPCVCPKLAQLCLLVNFILRLKFLDLLLCIGCLLLEVTQPGFQPIGGGICGLICGINPIFDVRGSNGIRNLGGLPRISTGKVDLDHRRKA